MVTGMTTATSIARQQTAAPRLNNTTDRRLVNADAQLRWLQSRQGQRRLAQWALGHETLAAWSAVELIGPDGSAATDAMQAALVAIAQDGDGDAALLLLTQLRAGLHRICRWTVAAGFWPQREAVPEVRAAFFETLYRHPLPRRPTKIAANLVLDTRQRIQRAQRPVVDVISPGADQFGDPTGRLATDLAVVSTVRSAIAGLPGSAASRRLTADLAHRVWFLDEPRPVVAAELGLGDQAAYLRLHRLRSSIDRDQLCD